MGQLGKGFSGLFQGRLDDVMARNAVLLGFEKADDDIPPDVSLAAHIFELCAGGFAGGFDHLSRDEIANMREGLAPDSAGRLTLSPEVVGGHVQAEFARALHFAAFPLHFLDVYAHDVKPPSVDTRLFGMRTGVFSFNEMDAPFRTPLNVPLIDHQVDFADVLLVLQGVRYYRFNHKGRMEWRGNSCILPVDEALISLHPVWRDVVANVHCNPSGVAELKALIVGSLPFDFEAFMSVLEDEKGGVGDDVKKLLAAYSNSDYSTV